MPSSAKREAMRLMKTSPFRQARRYSPRRHLPQVASRIDGAALQRRARRPKDYAVEGRSSFREQWMKSILALATLGLAVAGEARATDAAMPFVAHRAAYMITLAKGDGAQAPIGASGLIAYEFRGSPCEGY